MKRTRLSKSGTSARRDRLASAIRFEVTQMSESQLKDFAGATKSVLNIDPLVKNYYQPLAKNELIRRKGLANVWGKETPVLPPKGLLAVSEILEQPSKVGKKVAAVYYDLASGKFAEDVVAGTDYLVDKLGELHKRGERAKERWVGFAKAHGVLGKNENDYLKEGFMVKTRFNHDVNPKVLEQAHRSYKAGYKDVIVLPSNVDGKMMYSVLVKDVK